MKTQARNKPDSVSLKEMTVIYLCSQPDSLRGEHPNCPIWPCSEWGLPCIPLLPEIPVVSYTTFSPLLITQRSIFCGTFPEVTLAWISQALCSLESGLSSGCRKASCDRLPCLRKNYFNISGKYRIFPQTSH